MEKQNFFHQKYGRSTITAGGLFGNEPGVIPLVMPKKYFEVIIRYQSYRNYYQDKLKKRALKKYPFSKSTIKWTNRQKPEWIEL